MCFPKDFQTALGPAHLSHFYQQVAMDSLSAGFVAEACDGTRLVGVCVGSVNPRLFASILLRRPIMVLGCVLKGLFLHPSIFGQLLRKITTLHRVFYARGVWGMPETKVSDNCGSVARLMHVAVDPQWRGRRIAEALVADCAGAMWQAGAARFASRVRAENDASLKLWQRLGWNVCRTDERGYHIWIDREEDCDDRSP